MSATGTGLLDGLRLAVKDMFAVEGHSSSFGHPRWRETHSPWSFTAPVLDRLLSAGASVTGLAKLDQLAWSIVGNAGEGVAPLNPAYPDRFTCGSSSGPASALGQALPTDAVAVLPVMNDLPPLRTASAAELQEFRVSAFRLTTPASLAGRPELVVPVSAAASGMRIGVGILGPVGGDAELVRLAARICPSRGALPV
jgi:Asp-tRNA(Asn)/Glu-tRNA(Gln) amidotransferase A subunit family amidase